MPQWMNFKFEKIIWNYSEDGQIIFIKNGPCQELLTRPQSVEVEQIDPFDDVQEDEEEDCSDSEDSDSDEVVEVVWVDNCYWMYRKFRILLEIK